MNKIDKRVMLLNIIHDCDSYERSIVVPFSEGNLASEPIEFMKDYLHNELKFDREVIDSLEPVQYITVKHNFEITMIEIEFDKVHYNKLFCKLFMSSKEFYEGTIDSKNKSSYMLYATGLNISRIPGEGSNSLGFTLGMEDNVDLCRKVKPSSPNNGINLRGKSNPNSELNLRGKLKPSNKFE